MCDKCLSSRLSVKGAGNGCWGRQQTPPTGLMGAPDKAENREVGTVGMGGAGRTRGPDGGADNMEMLIIYPLPFFDLPPGTCGSAPQHSLLGVLPARFGAFSLSFPLPTFSCVCVCVDSTNLLL